MRVIRSASAVVVTISLLAFAACGGSSSGNGSGDLGGTTLSYLGFGGVLDERINEAWMKPFGEETGAQFVLDSPTDYSKIQVQVESGNVSYDIIDGDQFFINPQCGELFEELDIDQSNVLPQFRSESSCGVPNYVYGIGMYYDNAAFPDGGPQDCDDFFDTDAFPGTRMIWTYVAAAGVLECAAIAAGADPKNPYPLDLDAAFAELEGIKDNLVTFDSGAQVNDAMVNGDAPIVMATTRNYVESKENGADYSAATGFAGRGAGALAIPKGAPNKDAAIEYLEYISDPEVGQRLPKEAPPYSSVTGGEIPEDWPEAAKEVEVVSGPLSEVAWDIDQVWWAENYDAVAERYSELLAG